MWIANDEARSNVGRGTLELVIIRMTCVSANELSRTPDAVVSGMC